MLALERPEAAGQVFNIGSGRDVSILQVGDAIARAMGLPHLQPEVVGKARTGDVRHCFGDIGRAHRVLGFTPKPQLRRQPGRAGGVGAAAAGGGPGGPGPAGAGAAGPGGVSGHPSVLRPPHPGDGRRRVHRRQPGRPAGPRRAGRAGVRRPRPAPAWRATWSGCKRRHPRRVSSVIADVRDEGAVRDAAMRCSARVPPGRPGGGHHVDDGADGRFRRERARHACTCWRRCAAGRTGCPWCSPAPTRSTATCTTSRCRTRRRRLPAHRPGVARRRRGRGARALDFYTPYGCSKGAADQYVLDYARGPSACPPAPCG